MKQFVSVTVSIILVLALPAVAAAPGASSSTCDVQIQIQDGHNLEGLAISGERTQVIMPCVSKAELAKIIRVFAKGNVQQKDRALHALNRAKEIKLLLTPEVVTQAKD